MKKVYIDTDYKCHVTDDGTMIAVENEFFNNKCQTFVEGHRYVPNGEQWTRDDSTVFQGEMITAWKPYDELDAAQREYERQLLTDAENALAILFGGDPV